MYITQITSEFISGGSLVFTLKDFGTSSNVDYYCYGVSSNDKKVCSGHGKCLENGTCLCDNDSVRGYWVGDQCQSCLNHFDYRSNCTECLNGYDGELCEHKVYSNNTICFGVSSADPNVCSRRGSCIAVDTCVCNDHYEGNKCQNTFCFGIPSTRTDLVCSGDDHGRCVDFNQCVCKKGYTSYDCRVWNQGKGLWITTVIMVSFTSLSLLFVLLMVCIFKMKHGRVEYMRMNPLDDSDEDEQEDLFVNDEEEIELDTLAKPSTQEEPTIIFNDDNEDLFKTSNQQISQNMFSVSDSDEEDKL
jgi:hypothetical protein